MNGDDRSQMPYLCCRWERGLGHPRKGMWNLRYSMLEIDHGQRHLTVQKGSLCKQVTGRVRLSIVGIY
jgi:hypothetical protein